MRSRTIERTVRNRGVRRMIRPADIPRAPASSGRSVIYSEPGKTGAGRRTRAARDARERSRDRISLFRPVPARAAGRPVPARAADPPRRDYRRGRERTIRAGRRRRIAVRTGRESRIVRTRPRRRPRGRYIRSDRKRRPDRGSTRRRNREPRSTSRESRRSFRPAAGNRPR